MITPEKLTVASSVSGQISACLIEVVEVYTLSRSFSLSSVGAPSTSAQGPSHYWGLQNSDPRHSLLH